MWSRKQESLDGWCNTSVLHPTELSGLSPYPEIGQLSRDRLEHKEHRRQSLTAPPCDRHLETKKRKGCPNRAKQKQRERKKMLHRALKGKAKKKLFRCML